ncbi:MAG: ATP-dependent helicase [Candidatus Wallbacteria bacterium]
MTDVKVSIGIEFLNAYSRIMHSEQKRVREFIEKFRENPRSSSINYEKIHDMKDKNVRTVRINEAYRAIILNPELGNNYILVWVDHHDEAMDWARNKKFDINKYTGAIEILDYEFIEKLKQEKYQNDYSQKPLFHSFKDEELLIFGVPEVLLAAVRNVMNENSLDEISKYLPSEAAEALYFLASGYSAEQTLNEVAAKVKITGAKSITPIDAGDYEKALENEHTQKRFRVVEDADELKEILDAPLEKWRIFLHPSQRKIVKINASGPVKVLGGAGTGKTVVAMHRAKYLAENIFTKPEDKILFTTYSKSLAADIKNSLEKICAPEIMSRIEVTNIDLWVTAFLRRHGYNFQIVNDEDLKYFWAEALKCAPPVEGLDEIFYRDEWKNAIQSNSAYTLEKYLKVTRFNSGRRLMSATRRKIWPVFEKFMALLKESSRTDLIELTHDAIKYVENNPGELNYKAVVVDEGQDIGSEYYKLIRKLAPAGHNDIFITGDCHQKIYDNRVILSRCGIKIKGQRVKKLTLNYRTTEEIRKWALKLFENKEIGDMDGGADFQEGYRSLLHGPAPEISGFDNQDKEIEYIINRIGELKKQGVKLENICIAARKSELVNRYREKISDAGFLTFLISRDALDSENFSGVRFSTMHRVKGLEFDYIFIVSANKGIIPLKKAVDCHLDAFSCNEADLRERSLLYVASTRAKKEVFITYNGEKSEYLINNQA